MTTNGQTATCKYFNSKRNFSCPCFCQAHLIGKTKEEISKEDIWCHIECQPLIAEECHLAGKTRKYDVLR